MGWRQRQRWVSRALAIAGAGLLFLAIAHEPAAPAAAARLQAGAASVQYAAGWNLVAAPSGTVLDQAAGQQFTYGTASNAYRVVRSGEIIGGRSYWAYFPTDTTLALGATPADAALVSAPANQWVLMGNPSVTETLAIQGADVALTYDPATGYRPATALKPGQGAFVMSRAGGDIMLGHAPGGNDADKLRALQAGLDKDASDVSNFAMFPAVASDLLTAGDYASVQAGMDDLRSSFVDGLEREGSATVPPLTAVQLSSIDAVRMLLTQARDATAAGDKATADRAVSQAKQQAQMAEDNAAARERDLRSQNGGSAAGPSWLAAAQSYTPQSLAEYGALCIATVPALGLALAPSMPFVNLVLATLSGQPLPPAPTGTTPTPTPATSLIVLPRRRLAV